MKKRTQILLVLGILLCVLITSFNLLKLNRSTVITNQTSKLPNNLMVPEHLQSLELTDLENNRQEIFSGESPYKLLVFGNETCEACAMLLEDVYKNEKKIVEKSIDINFIWTTTSSEAHTISNYLEEKVGSYTTQYIQNFRITMDEYNDLGFGRSPTPLIAVYNAEGELRFQSYGYSEAMIEHIMYVDNLNNPFIQGWE